VTTKLDDLAGRLDVTARRLRDYATGARKAVHDQEKILPRLLRVR
jgi:hypothetical protein